VNELVLFAGACGGALGTQHLLGWRPVGYVEWDDYCCQVTRQRIKDGLLAPAPVFCMDVRDFIGLGFAKLYRGVAEAISAGFPCQPFSVAGPQLGEDDPRNMWPATIRCIRIIRPQVCLLENVPAIRCPRREKGHPEKTKASYFGRVVSDLAASGYRVRWDCIPASAVGAPHQRDRLWIVATRAGWGFSSHQQGDRPWSSGGCNDGLVSCQWRHATARGRRRDGRADEQGEGPPRRVRAGEGREDVAHAPMLLGETIVGREPNGVLSKDVPNATEDGCRKGRPGRPPRVDQRIPHATGALADAEGERERT
jgi:DNA (cytosine-5)-methyltransferase 1